MKKYLASFLFFFAFICSTALGQIQFSGCGEVILNNFYGEDLYVIQQQNGSSPFGKIIFTPPEGGHPWTFSWTYNGVSQPVNSDDTLRLEVDIPGDGFYTFQASREGMVSSAAPRFHVFFDHVPEFSIVLTDVLNCTAVSIAPVTDFEVPVYRYQGTEFEGSKTVDYLLPGKTVPIRFDNYELALKEKQGALSVDSEDQDVTVTITDKFGFSWTSKPVHYTSVIPKAEAEPELLNTVDIVGEVNEEMGQAPLEVYFHNNSVNASAYQWLLYKDTTDMAALTPDLADSLLDEQIRTQPEFLYTYEHTGRYKVRLIAVNEQGNRCQDTTAALYINVIESLLDVPNVFTPNGDGINDVFMVKALSLTDFHAVILNRWGRKVYEWSDPTGGWDGRIHGKYANPGTYYFIITARGLEKNNPPKYTKKGALMLIR